MMANKLAQRIKLSLVSPTLSCIYHGLKEMFINPAAGKVGVHLPMHYLFGFFAYYSPGFYCFACSRYFEEMPTKANYHRRGYFPRHEF